MSTSAHDPGFHPVHDAHAIAEETIFFEFMPPLEQAMPALIALKDDFKSDFPAAEVMNLMRMQVIQKENQQPEIASKQVSEGTGIKLSRFQTDGTLDEQINIDLNSAVITCYKYSRWADIWPRQKSYISRIFARISGTSSFLSGIGMQWVDQFVFNGSDADYDVAKILRLESMHVNPLAFRSGTRWHCHTGWFDSGTIAGHEILNQLNLDAGPTNVRGGMRTTVTISHNQVVRIANRLDELAVFAPGGDPDHHALSGLMEALHDGNKRVLSELLIESLSERIGLRAG